MSLCNIHCSERILNAARVMLSCSLACKRCLLPKVQFWHLHAVTHLNHLRSSIICLSGICCDKNALVAGLYLPTSDMDLVVIKSHCTDIPRALRAIGNILVENQMAKNIQVGSEFPQASSPNLSAALIYQGRTSEKCRCMCLLLMSKLYLHALLYVICNFFHV